MSPYFIKEVRVRDNVVEIIIGDSNDPSFEETLTLSATDVHQHRKRRTTSGTQQDSSPTGN